MRAPLVGLMGTAQSGKDTFAGLLGYRRIAFADVLKQMALRCDPAFYLDGYDWYGLNTIVDMHGWEYAKAVPGVREFLQNLGAAVRHYDQGFWVRAALHGVDGYDPSKPTVITDVRYINEVQAIRARGGFIVRIDRPGVESPNNHVSEHEWRSVTPDLSVLNDTTIDRLAAEADRVDAEIRRRIAR